MKVVDVLPPLSGVKCPIEALTSLTFYGTSLGLRVVREAHVREATGGDNHNTSIAPAVRYRPGEWDRTVPMRRPTPRA